MADLSKTLERLEHLSKLVQQKSMRMLLTPEQNEQLHKEICETYGEVADVYSEFAGTKNVDVPDARGQTSSRFPNYFEAGFLSGRTIHTHQGKTELQKVIGIVRSRCLAKGSSPPRTLSNRVFLVHGRDESALNKCARFLERLGCEAVILHEMPNKGRTIIQKFIDYSDVGFAVVLLTPDDRGGLMADKNSDLKPRARQNVMLELGFFLGRLGPDRVCALHCGDVEIPSDYDGVVFIPMDDNNAWRMGLARELHAAGLNVDLTKVV